jgi:hypothetical protein
LQNKILIRVFRRNTVKGDTDHHYDVFEVPVKRSTTVLDALLYVKSYLVTNLIEISSNVLPGALTASQFLASSFLLIQGIDGVCYRISTLKFTVVIIFNELES